MRTPALSFILITLCLDVLGIGLIVPILPKLVESFSGGNTADAAYASGWLSAVYALMQFVCAPFLGVLSDKVGRRPVILVSQFGLALDYLLLAVAPSMAWFFVGRVIAGITGANFAAATAYIADVSPPEKRAANFGLVGAAFGIGFIIGPLLGGWLGSYGLRVPFYVSAALTLANWCYGWFILPESLAPEKRRPLDWARSNPLGSLLDLFRRPKLFGLAMCAFFSFVAHQVYPSVWVLYTGHKFGWGTAENGCALAAVGVCMAIVQGWLTGKVTAKLGDWSTALWGLLISAAAYLCYGLSTAPWMIYGTILVGALGGISGPAVQGLIANAVGDDEQGAVQGAVTSLESVSGMIGPLLCTQLFAYFITPTAPLHLPGAPFFASAFIAAISWWIAWRTRVRQAPENKAY
jgi:MFS transporter, DHA1 family, tetracycline resistance protein